MLVWDTTRPGIGGEFPRAATAIAVASGRNQHPLYVVLAHGGKGGRPIPLEMIVAGPAAGAQP